MTTQIDTHFDSREFSESSNPKEPKLIDVHDVSNAIIALEKLAHGPSKEAMKGEILAGLSKLPGVTWATFTEEAELLFLAYGKTSKENRENLAKTLWFHPHILRQEV